MAAPTKATNTLNYFSDSDILVPHIMKKGASTPFYFQ